MLWNLLGLPNRPPGSERPPRFQAFLLAGSPAGGLLLATGTAETRVFVVLPSGKGGGGSPQCGKSDPGSEWVRGNGQSRGRGPPAGKRSADHGRRVRALGYTDIRHPGGRVPGRPAGRPSAPRFSAQTGSAGEIKTAAESGRSPPVLGAAAGQRDGDLWLWHVARGPGTAPAPRRSSMSSGLTKRGSPPRSWLSLRLGTGESVFLFFRPERRVDDTGRETSGVLEEPLSPRAC